MTATPPLVSVSMLTYNHEKYVAEAIRSVLQQTYLDLELVIVDDGSTDDTPRLIASFDDPRIVSIRQPNQGPCAAANRSYRTCRGRYIALMSGDDVCHPDRLERQLNEYRRGGPRLLFSAVDLIDEEGRPLNRASFLDGVFEVSPIGRAEIYHRFFHRGNFLNAITGFTETEVMRTHGLCDPCLLQLQDYDQWVRLIKTYDICLLPQSTLNYRIRDKGQNLSAPDPARSVRATNELFLIMRRFFDGVSPELFREAFHDEFLRPDAEHPIALRCEQAFLLVRSVSTVRQLVGIEMLQALLHDPDGAAVLRTEYQLDLPAFYRLLGELVVFNTATDNVSTLFLDVGDGFNEVDTCRARVNPHNARFEVAFELPRTRTVRQLRWDPFEGQLGQVHVEEIDWQTPEGRQGEVDVARISTNGVRGNDGVYTFDTPDPNIIIPFAGPLTRLTVRGQWVVEPAESTRLRFLSLQKERDALRAELAMRQEELARRDQQLHSILTSRRWRAADKMHALWRRLRGRRSA